VAAPTIEAFQIKGNINTKPNFTTAQTDGWKLFLLVDKYDSLQKTLLLYLN